MFDKICDNVKYLISEKRGIADSINHNFGEISGIADSINHNFGEIRIDSFNYLPIEKMLTFDNVIILINQLLKRMNITITVIHF